MAKQKRAPVLIDLALQGGGSHGAFTWGVLDRLLEEPWLQVDAISGTSAGAMNAAVLSQRVDQRRRRRRARSTRCLLGSRGPGSDVQPGAAHADRPRAWALVARQFTGLHWPRADGAHFFALRPQSARLQPADFDPGTEHRFRTPGAIHDQAVHHGDQCAHRSRPHLSQRRDHTGRAARVGVPADDVSGRRDRWRGLLGWRLRRQSDNHAAGAGEQCAGHHPGADQSARAPGHPREPQTKFSIA